MAIYFAKDFLFLVVLISFVAAFRRKKVAIFKPPSLIPLLIFIWFGGMQIFNPASTSIWYGLMGFKIFFYYVPLIILGYALLNSEAELRRSFTVYLILALVIISLGIAHLPRFTPYRRNCLPADISIRQRRPLLGFHHGGLEPGSGIQRLPAAAL